MWLSPTDPSLAWLHSLVHDRDTEVSIIHADFINSLSPLSFSLSRFVAVVILFSLHIALSLIPAR